MKTYFACMICLTILIMSLTACIGNPVDATSVIPNVGMPDIGIPPEEMNTHFQVIPLKAVLKNNNDNSIVLDIKVVSDDQIAFTSDYGSKIFLYENDHWVQIEDFMNQGKGTYILDKNSWGAGTMMGVAPILPDPYVESLLRIILVGNIYRNGRITDEQTAAYTDMLLRP